MENLVKYLWKYFSIEIWWYKQKCLVYYTSRAPEREMFSEPARSTRLSFPHFIISSPSGVHSLMWIVMENMEWERLLCLFRRVSAVRLFADPLSKILYISFAEQTISSSKPLTKTPPFPSSMRAIGFLDLSSINFEVSSGAKRSVISSLYNSRCVTFMLYSAFWASKISKICLTALGITPASLGNSPFWD